MNYFVFYADDWEEVGLEEFVQEEDAMQFIQHRMSEWPEKRTLDNYQVIYGKRVELVPVEYVKTLRVVR